MRGTQQSACSKLVHVKSKWEPRLGAGGDGCLACVRVCVCVGGGGGKVSRSSAQYFYRCSRNNANTSVPRVSETGIVMFEDHSAHGFKTIKCGVGPNY